MKRPLAMLLAAMLGAAAWQSAEACRFCQSGAEVGRYGNQDPMNSVDFDALTEPYRDMVAPVPKPEEVVTTKAALAQAAAVAVPQPGAQLAPVTPNSYRSRLLPQTSAAVPAAPKDSAAGRDGNGSKVKPLGTWASRAVDASILGALAGVVMFFRRGTRRQVA